MTPPVWLACCEPAEYPVLLREVRTRHADARLLRFGGLESLPRLAHGLPAGADGAAVFMSADELDAVEESLARLGGDGFSGEVVAFAYGLDAGIAARLFHAGATEVIAADGAMAPRAAEEVRARRGTNAADGAATPDGTCGEVEGGDRHREALRPEVGDMGREVLSGDCAGPMEAPGQTGNGARLTALKPDAGEAGGPVASVGTSPSVAGPSASSMAARAPIGTDEDLGLPASAAAVTNVISQPAASQGPQAPVIVVASGRGGVGKTALAACMAATAARRGLRTAVIDLDLMTGCLHGMLGIDEPHDLALLLRGEGGRIADADIEAAAMRVGPGLTLWGPIAEPERADLMGSATEQLVRALRGLADAIFIDTSTFWGDAVAAAVSACDRCLFVGAGAVGEGPAARRMIGLAERLGAPRTKMACVVNRVGARGVGEEEALRFEMDVSLRTRFRVADGGPELASMLAFGRAADAVAGSSAFARDVERLSVETLRELGCMVAPVEDRPEASAHAGRPLLKLPWRQGGDRP